MRAEMMCGQIENNTPCVYAIGFIVTMDIALPTIQFIRVRMVFLLFKNNFYPILCFVLKRSVYIGKGKLELLKTKPIHFYSF